MNEKIKQLADNELSYLKASAKDTSLGYALDVESNAELMLRFIQSVVKTALKDLAGIDADADEKDKAFKEFVDNALAEAPPESDPIEEAAH